MSLLPHELELLAPARDVEIGRQAILHGADAVYLGGPVFGARANAANSVADIAKLVEFAHRYHARIFTTINTILHDAELEEARKLVWQLYDAGVDALIIQDMGLLEMDLPPIQLHASTQCDIRKVEKAKFLADSGFSQLVLARELTVQEIAAVHDAVGNSATIEYFIHGALCVAFSGQCYISQAETGRSANRGDCSQACRLPYTLTDQSGAVVAFDKHLLSMKDNNQSGNLEHLIDAGVRSFKIEGRYKDMAYVKNITAHYRILLDEIMEQRGEFTRASSGTTRHYFRPDPDRNFHRGSTDYFASGRKIDIGAFDSPKFIGQPVGHVIAVNDKSIDIQTGDELHNGDGLNFMRKREVMGLHVNRAEKLHSKGEGQAVYRVFPKDPISSYDGLKAGLPMHRNRDHAWDMALNKESAERRIGLWLTLTEWMDGDVLKGLQLSLTDEDGVAATAQVEMALELAKQADTAVESIKTHLGKLGGTDFSALGLNVHLSQPWFVPASTLNAMRREAIEALNVARVAAWQRPPRKEPVQPYVEYPEKSLSFLANVYNDKAREFYKKHGVQMIAAAYESHEEAGEVPVMITKHCLRFSFNLCPKQAKGVSGVQGQVKADPMVLVNGDQKYTLKFDCKPCEMHIMGKMRKDIFNSPPPSVVPITFMKRKPA
ncbi:MAG: U32 family peptidase [Gammaproteobacteria bacterium]|uniref:peptidase U32 family protein n=1 Tax=Limnobacter sp. TaxID=2003368 RepID=UPI001D8F55EC|nr:U32 family peptidase [Limnobacter sp.]MBU0782322.1 U32 family peptidase [Gammaproteobacteria bacterium]MBU0849910.1 U32 family peptidase [Gammaproteobacteria bacterium]MBU1268676.1 U32 family peptidase [Gammaproteobacteria bacterium]MBU1528542.1 U32 family peptidase [Gammaproteobacteria bacterium]MBU1781222.1 U32 family peptidase [Gammaproteobacteria bacterium]